MFVVFVVSIDSFSLTYTSFLSHVFLNYVTTWHMLVDVTQNVTHLSLGYKYVLEFVFQNLFSSLSPLLLLYSFIICLLVFRPYGSTDLYSSWNCFRFVIRCIFL